MLAATACGALFLVVFVVRFARFGFRPFGGRGAWRVAYLAVFFTHEPVAVVNVSLVLAAAILGLRRSDAAHREVARMAWPVWVFVALTGLLLYLMLIAFRTTM